jgi:hypothetical protein
MLPAIARPRLGPKMFSASCLLLTVFILASLASAQTTDNWTGSTGVWSDVTQWDSGVPVAGDNIVIGTASANSTDDFSLGIGTLTLSNAGDSLVVANGETLTVGGNIANAGSIQLASAIDSTYLLLSGNVTLTGTGTLTMNKGNNFIDGTSAGAILTNSSTIQGTGYLGINHLGLVNNGTVLANIAGSQIFLDADTDGFNNVGTLSASPGTITVNGPFLNYNATTNTLTGGSYIANGGNISILVNTDGIATLSARVTQEAGGLLVNQNGGSGALQALSSITSTGVLTTSATFNQPGAFSMAGALNILPNTSFSVKSLAQIKNNALTAGQWVLDSNFNITGTPANITTNSATLTLSGGTFYNTENSTSAFANLSANKKTLRILNFAQFTSVGTLTNTGQMTVAKGSKLTIGGSGTSYSQPSGKTTLDGMLIGTTNVAGGTLLGAGSYTGNVAIGGTTAATFSLGDTGKSAQVKVIGTYTQNATGTLIASIGGATVGTQYSQLKVTMGAAVSGTLSAPLIGTFVPTVGQTFTVVSAKSVAGTFSNATIAINSSEHFAVSYTTTAVVLTVVSGPASVTE